MFFGCRRICVLRVPGRPGVIDQSCQGRTHERAAARAHAARAHAARAHAARAHTHVDARGMHFEVHASNPAHTTTAKNCSSSSHTCSSRSRSSCWRTTFSTTSLSTSTPAKRFLSPRRCCPFSAVSLQLHRGGFNDLVCALRCLALSLTAVAVACLREDRSKSCCPTSLEERMRTKTRSKQSCPTCRRPSPRSLGTTVSANTAPIMITKALSRCSLTAVCVEMECVSEHARA